MQSRTYRNTTMTQTTTTTSVLRGRGLNTYTATRNVIELRGAVNKPAAQRPFLTTWNEARDYVRSTLDANTE